MNVLYSPQHLGGPQNDVTRCHTTFITWRLMHLAALLRRNGGFPSTGNSRPAWDAGTGNPIHR